MEGIFSHVVFFWLKEPENRDARQKFEESLTRFINNSPQVLTSHIGASAGSTRDVVDGSFTYSLAVTFNSKKEHDIYQDDPAHHEFIAECQDLWDRVQVYDSIGIN